MTSKLTVEKLVHELCSIYLAGTILTVLALACFMFLVHYVGFILYPLANL